MKSPETTEQLARAYREARALVLGDRTPKVDRAVTLHRDFIAFPPVPAGAGRSAPNWDTNLYQKTRRATIVALRHHALLLLEATRGESPTIDAAQANTAIRHAHELAQAALDLHTNGDEDQQKTVTVVEAVRTALAEALRPAAASEHPVPASAPLLSAPTKVVDPGPAVRPSPAPTVATLTRQVNEGASQTPRYKLGKVVPLRGVAVGVAAVAVGVIGYFTVAARPEEHARPAGTQTVRPIASPVPNPQPSSQPAAAAPQSKQSPAPRPAVAQQVTVMVRSKPAGARVTVGGRVQGTTPLRLRGRPGQRLTLLLYKGELVWRGTILLATGSEQTMNVALTPPRGAPQVGVAPANAASSQFEIALRSGIELYKQGWYGPAAGRFSQATTLNPRSAEAHLWWARALAKVHRYDEARRALDTVTALEKSGPLAEEAAALRRRLSQN